MKFTCNQCYYPCSLIVDPQGLLPRLCPFGADTPVWVVDKNAIEPVPKADHEKRGIIVPDGPHSTKPENISYSK